MYDRSEIVLYNCTSRMSDPEQEVIAIGAGGKLGMTVSKVTSATKIATIRTKRTNDFVPGVVYEQNWSGPRVKVPVETLCAPRYHLMTTRGPEIYLFGCPPQVAIGTYSLPWSIRCKIFGIIGNVVDRVADIHVTDFVGWRPGRAMTSTPPHRLPLLPHQDNMNYRQLKSALICGFSPMTFKPDSSSEWQVSLQLERYSFNK